MATIGVQYILPPLIIDGRFSLRLALLL